MCAGTLCAGSHTSLVLLEAGAKVTILDNLSNSFLRVLDHLKKLAGDKAVHVKFVQVRVGHLPFRPAACLVGPVLHAPCCQPHHRAQGDINDYDLITKLLAGEK